MSVVPAPPPPRGPAVRRRVLVVDRGPDLTEALRDALRDAGTEVVHLGRTTALLDTVHDAGPWDAVVAGPSEESRAALERLAELRRQRPDLGLLVAVNGHEPADLDAFVRARPDLLVRVPTASDRLRDAIEEVLAAVAERRGQHADRAARATVVAPPPALARVIAVTGPTGGSGKTTVATSLAYLLAHSGGGRVVLADLDAQFGEVTTALQLHPATTIYDLLYDDSGRAYDHKVVAEHLAEGLTDTAGGFQVLPAPSDPVQADAIDAAAVGRMLPALRAQADTVVLDCSTGLDERTLAALDHTAHVVVVTQIDVPGIANLRTFLSTLDRLEVDPDDRTVVLNKEIADSGVTGRDVVAVLGPVGGVLPFDPAVTRALNSGRPVVAAEPTHPLSAKLIEALRPLLPGPPPSAPPPARRGLARLFSRG